MEKRKFFFLMEHRGTCCAHEIMKLSVCSFVQIHLAVIGPTQSESKLSDCSWNSAASSKFDLTPRGIPLYRSVFSPPQGHRACFYELTKLLFSTPEQDKEFSCSVKQDAFHQQNIPTTILSGLKNNHSHN